ncbi:decapping and exoribonuclease protein-like [Neodiprion fabricii]|uniref:decapping and exoribonuclease protein-like n=1 Tax=Neodiprion fabricii TaxID=2872261 RepID=UPI001ED96290|nr:decapping and exoribonuclease protein-like [Neodiprion fabricii]
METSRFRINRSWNGEGFPHFSRPEVSGCFSLNENREFLPNTVQLKYFNASPSETVKFDLKVGYDLVIRKTAEADNERLDHLLRWILLNCHKIRAPPDSNRWLQPHFVCFRGLLTMLWCTPFEKQEGWIICASKWQGTIYLCAFDTEEKKLRKSNISKKQLQFMSWGFKFEQYLLTDSPGQASDTSKPVNEGEEFCCMFTSRLGNNRLLYGAEMDGVSSNEVLREPIDWKGVKFVELKTSRVIENRRQEENFRRYKLIKWWCQSFLVGIENVCCGFRDDDGIVRNLTNYSVPEMTRMSKGIWNASECMNFCNEFLNFVQSVVTKDYNECVYKFEWVPGNDVQVHQMDSESKYSFLRPWFIDEAKVQMTRR